MSLKPLDKSRIHKILVISLTNIGDVILTFPVVDRLKKDFPSAKLSIVVGPKAESLLKGNPYVKHVYIFDKHQSPFKSLSWIYSLQKEKFDLVVDLRNTAIPLFIFPRYRTSYRLLESKGIHRREKHLMRLKSVYEFEAHTVEPCCIFVSHKDEEYVNQIVEKKIGRNEKYVIIAPGAADSAKRWPEGRFASLCDRLIVEHKLNIVLVGDNNDREVSQRIRGSMKNNVVDLSGQINLIQLAHLFQRCYFTVVNDSAPMHLASYLDIPVLALFGPTDPLSYGPWSSRAYFLRKNEQCDKCRNPKKLLPHICMEAITGDDAYALLQENLIL